MNIIAAAILVSVPAFQTLALAQSNDRAQLRLVVVDETSAPLPNATVTVFTLDGHAGRTVTADEKGVAVFVDLPVGLTQVWARMPAHRSSAEGTRLKVGENTQTVTLETGPVTDTDGADSASSGS